MSQNNQIIKENKFAKQTETLYFGIVESVIEQIKDSIQGGDINDLEEHDAEEIADVWQEKLKQLQQSNQDEIFEADIKELIEKDIEYENSLKRKNNLFLDENHEEEPLFKKVQSDTLDLFKQQSTNNKDLFSEINKKQQDEEQMKLEEKKKKEQEDIQEQLKQKENEQNLQQKTQSQVREEVRYFLSMLHSEKNNFNGDNEIDDEQDNSDDIEYKQSLQKLHDEQKTPNICFGNYEDLKESAKKWIFKLKNVVIKTNQKEEYIVSNLKVDLHTKGK